MVYVNIKDNTDDKIDMSAETEQLEIHPWIVLNLNEIGETIAMQLFDAEYKITQEILDDEINHYLSEIHERIFEKSIEVLESNNIEVY